MHVCVAHATGRPKGYQENEHRTFGRHLSPLLARSRLAHLCGAYLDLRQVSPLSFELFNEPFEVDGLRATVAKYMNCKVASVSVIGLHGDIVVYTHR